MAKLTLTNPTNLNNESSFISLITTNNDAIEAAMENTLSRDGTTPNSMNAALDMNGYAISNLPAPTQNTHPFRLIDAATYITAAEAAQTAAEAAQTAAEAAQTTTEGYKDQTLIYQNNAQTYANNAASSAVDAAAQAAKLQGTSVTSIAIGTGAQVFTTQADKYFDAGNHLLIVSDAAPSTNWMFGQVTSYSSTSLTVDVAVVGGSGTLADWTIYVAGARGATGAQGPQGDPGTGDVVGPASAVDSRLAAFDTTTGKLLKDSGFLGSDFATSGHNHTLDSLSNVTITGLASEEILKWNGSAWVNTANPQLTTIELGHASDTTLSRVSAGVVAIEGSNILKASDIGSTVQAYDADTTKNDVANTFTLQQTIPTISLTGGQIVFPATAAPSANANTLDDYEEGTWTPTYTTTGTDFTSVTYDTQSAVYTKIGATVWVGARVRTDAITVGSASGNVVIGGLPFTAAGQNEGGVVVDGSAFGGDTPRSLRTLNATTTMSLFYRTAANTADTNLAVADLGTGANANDCRFVAQYTI